jgi:hypothetical protein
MRFMSSALNFSVVPEQLVPTPIASYRRDSVASTCKVTTELKFPAVKKQSNIQSMM